ncbi:MAG: transporter [Acidobacteriaceae bacterium]
MTAATATSVLGLIAAAIWGAADFCGGMAARRLNVFWLLAISHAFSFACLLAIIGLLHEREPSLHILSLGLWSGIAGGIALLTFYHALSLGEMGITASVTGLLTAALPVIFSLFTIGAPSRRQGAGFILAAAAIWLISSQPVADRNAARQERKKLTLAVISGIGFGAFLIFLQQANGGGILWPLVASRVGSLALAIGGGLVFSRGRFTANTVAASNASGVGALWKVGIGLTLLSSLFDTTGNFFFVAATRTGRLDIAAVLASLYPAATILLAVWLLKERASRRQTLGMAAALVAVALIS